MMILTIAVTTQRTYLLRLRTASSFNSNSRADSTAGYDFGFKF